MEVIRDTTNELYVLGFVTGLCQQEPRDQLLLDDMLMYLGEVRIPEQIDHRFRRKLDTDSG